jgi:hypothetical protein
MNIRFRHLFFVCLASLTACTNAEAGAAYDCDKILRRADGTVFELFLGAKQGGDSDLEALCMKRLPVLKRVHFRTSESKFLGTVSDDTVRAVVGGQEGQPLVVINIEEWKTKGEDPVVAESVSKFVGVLKAAQSELPDTKFGIYSMVPIRDYFRAIGDRGPDAFTKWQSENDKLAAVATQANVLFPSVYTFHHEATDRWAKYAHANVLEARRLAPNKPIYPFIWNRYHKSKEAIDAAFMQGQFESLFAMQEASGAVMWLASKEEWDESATWVVGLRQFLDARANAGTRAP